VVDEKNWSGRVDSTTDLLVPNLGKAVSSVIVTLLTHALAAAFVCTALWRFALLRCIRMANFWQRFVEKRKFETTAEYEARRARATPKGELVFIVREAATFKYDADAAPGGKRLAGVLPGVGKIPRHRSEKRAHGARPVPWEERLWSYESNHVFGL
jgi:hypothetical protein